MKGRQGPPEFDEQFLFMITLLFEVNFSSIFLQKVFIKSATGDSLNICINIANQALQKAQRVQAYFSKVPSEVSESIKKWCDVAKMHFEMMMYYSIFTLNEMMVDRLVEKTKDIEQIYFEGNILGHKLFDLQGRLEQYQNGSVDDFNVTESAKFSAAFLNPARQHRFRK